MHPYLALAGDNVVERSTEMPWYGGLSLLEHLETVHIASDRNLIDFRFPVQLVIRPISSEHHDFRGYAATSRVACSRWATRWSRSPPGSRAMS